MTGTQVSQPNSSAAAELRTRASLGCVHDG
jgi:hypothetical protein